jgi:hypothetical protein
MKERVGRVEQVEIQKEMSGLQDRYPGGELMKSDDTQIWLEEIDVNSSNHPAQAPQETLSASMIGIESSTLLGSMLLRLIASRGDEERSSSV